MKSAIGIALSVGVMLVATQAVSAQTRLTSCEDYGGQHNGCLNQPTCCPNCHATCKFEAKTVKVDKSCYEVECKPICVPRVRFPWQKCCEPVCADVKYVKVLKTKKYQCEECEYSWSIDESKPCGCGSCESMGTPAAPMPMPENGEGNASYRNSLLPYAMGASMSQPVNAVPELRRFPTPYPIQQTSVEGANTSTPTATRPVQRFESGVVKEAQSARRSYR